MRKKLTSMVLLSAAAMTWMMSAEAADLSGKVVGPDGKGIYGVTVKAWNPSRKMARSVFTDRNGGYVIPDLFPETHNVSARMVGYVAATRNDLAVTQGGATADLAMKVTREIADQLSGADYLVNIPTDTMGKAFRQGCVVCHQIGTHGTRNFREGKNAFGEGIGKGPIDTKEDWLKVVNKMRGFDVYKVIPQFKNEDFAEWMVKNGFGNPPAIPAKSYLPPLDEAAAQVIVTEYAMGAGFTWLHDMTVGLEGDVWGGDYTLDQMYKLDPRTGHVQTYKYPVKGTGAHTLNPDKEGNIWTTLQLADMVARFNPRTEEWAVFGGLSKGSLVHTFAVDEFNNVAFDPGGSLWVSEFGRRHMASINPASRAAKEIELPEVQIPGFDFVPSPYGAAYNSKDGRIWYSQIGANVIGNVDPKTGEVKQYSMPEEWMGPRRLKAAPDGKIWIPFYSTGEIGAFDPKTESLKRYKLPHPGDTPYALVVDGATGIVWVCGTAANTIYRFDPKTERFVTIPLPSPAAFTRLVVVDYLTGDIYTSYSNFPNAHGEFEGGVVARIQLPPSLK